MSAIFSPLRDLLDDPEAPAAGDELPTEVTTVEHEHRTGHLARLGLATALTPAAERSPRPRLYTLHTDAVVAEDVDPLLAAPVTDGHELADVVLHQPISLNSLTWCRSTP